MTKDENDIQDGWIQIHKKDWMPLKRRHSTFAICGVLFLAATVAMVAGVAGDELWFLSLVLLIVSDVYLATGCCPYCDKAFFKDLDLRVNPFTNSCVHCRAKIGWTVHKRR